MESFCLYEGRQLCSNVLYNVGCLFGPCYTVEEYDGVSTWDLGTSNSHTETRHESGQEMILVLVHDGLFPTCHEITRTQNLRRPSREIWMMPFPALDLFA